MDDLNGEQAVTSKYQTGSRINSIVLAGNNTYLNWNDEGGWKSETGSIDLNKSEWTFLATTMSETDSYGATYVNGRKDIETTNIEGEISLNDGDQFIGGAGGYWELNGSIDEVRIYDTALNQTQINQLYFYGRDGEFDGDYAKTFSETEEQNWTSLTVDASNVDSETNFTIQFEVLNTTGSEIDNATFHGFNGEKTFFLNVSNSEEARLVFNGTSTNVTKTWAVNSFSLDHKNAAERTPAYISRGQSIPFADVLVSNRPALMVNRFGNFTEITSRVAVWR
jgi:hypothetical protein